MNSVSVLKNSYESRWILQEFVNSDMIIIIIIIIIINYNEYFKHAGNFISITTDSIGIVQEFI